MHSLYFHPAKAFQIKTVAEEKIVKTYNFTLPTNKATTYYFKSRISGSFLNTGYLSMFLTNQHNAILSRRGNKKNICEIEALLQPGAYSLSIYSNGEKDEALPCTRVAFELTIEKAINEDNPPKQPTDSYTAKENLSQEGSNGKERVKEQYNDKITSISSPNRFPNKTHPNSKDDTKSRREDGRATSSKCFSPQPEILKGIAQSSTYFIDASSHETIIHYTPSENGILRFAVVGRDDVLLSLRKGGTVLLDDSETKIASGGSTIISLLSVGESYDIVLSHNFVNAAACERVRLEYAFDGENDYVGTCDPATQEETFPDLSSLASGAILSFELPQTTFFRHNKATSKSSLIFDRELTFLKSTIVIAELLTDFSSNDMDMMVRCKETGRETASVHTLNRRTITKIFEPGSYRFVLYGGSGDSIVKAGCFPYTLSLSTKLYSTADTTVPLVPTRRLFPSTLMTPDLLVSRDSIIIDEEFRVSQVSLNSQDTAPTRSTEFTVRKESLFLLDAKDGVSNGASFSLLEDDTVAVVFDATATTSAVAYKLTPGRQYTLIADFSNWTAVHSSKPFGHYHTYLRIIPTDSTELLPADEKTCNAAPAPAPAPVQLSEGFVHYDSELLTVVTAKSNFVHEVRFKIQSDALLSVRLEQHAALSLYMTVLNEVGVAVVDGRGAVHAHVGKGAYVLRVHESTDFSHYHDTPPSVCVRARLVFDLSNPHGVSATGEFCAHDFFPITLDGLGSRFGAGLTISEQFRISAFNVPTTTEFSVLNESFFRVDIQRVSVDGENVPLSFSLVKLVEAEKSEREVKSTSSSDHETIVSQQREKNGIAAATILAPGKYLMSITFHYGEKASDIVLGVKDDWSVESRDPRYHDFREVLSCECFSASLALQRTELLEDASEDQCPLVHFPESAIYGVQESLTVTTPISPKGYVRELEISSETPLRIMASVLFDVATSAVHVSLQGHARSNSVAFPLQQEAVLTPNTLSVHADVPPGEYALVVEHVSHDPERWPSQLTCASYFLTYLVDGESERTNCASTATLPDEFFGVPPPDTPSDNEQSTDDSSSAQGAADSAFYHGTGFLLSSETEVQQTLVNIPDERFVHIFIEAVPTATRIAARFDSLRGAPVVQPSTAHDISFSTTGAFSLMLYADHLSEYCSYYAFAVSTITPSALARRVACPKQIDALPAEMELSGVHREHTFVSAFTKEEIESTSGNAFERKIRLGFTSAMYVEAKLRFDFAVDAFEMQLIDGAGVPVGNTSVSFNDEAEGVISCSATVSATAPTSYTLSVRAKKQNSEYNLGSYCRKFTLSVFAISSAAPRISKILPDKLVGFAPCKRLEFDVYLTAPANSDTLETDEFYLVAGDGKKDVDSRDEMDRALHPSSASLSLSRQRVKLVFNSGTLAFGTTYHLKRRNALKAKSGQPFTSNVETVVVSTAACGCGEHGVCATVDDARCAVCVCDLGFTGTTCARVDVQHRVTVAQTHLILAGVLTFIAVIVALPAGVSVWSKTQLVCFSCCALFICLFSSFLLFFFLFLFFLFFFVIIYYLFIYF